MDKKQLSIVEMSELLLSSDFPFTYFVFRKKEGVYDLLWRYQSRYGRSIPELNTGEFAHEFSISPSFIAHSFKSKGEISIFLILHLFSKCKEENFVQYHNKFIENFSGISVAFGLNPHYTKVPELPFPFDKKDLKNWLKKYEDAFKNFCLKRRDQIISSFSHRYKEEKRSSLPSLQNLLCEGIIKIINKDLDIVSKRIKKI